MKHPTSILRFLPVCAASFAMASALVAQVATTPAGTSKTATPPAPAAPALDLPRLKTKGKAGDPPQIAKANVTVDTLSVQGLAGARSVAKQNFNYLALDAGKEWSRPLRGGSRDTAFVSFLAYTSVGTTIEAAGAKLLVKPSTKAGYAQVEWEVPASGSPTPPILALIKIEKHDGADLVALPVLTLRLDPAAGTWDLFSFQRLVAEDIPLAEVRGARQFSVRPGAQGAWILNLTLSDENPLFVDTNGNGIDDAFEKSQRGGQLLATNAPAAQRTQLAQTWKAAQKAANIQPWRIRRPLPDVNSPK